MNISEGECMGFMWSFLLIKPTYLSGVELRMRTRLTHVTVRLEEMFKYVNYYRLNS